MSFLRSIRILVDLTSMRPGGEGGGIKPLLLDMLRWLAAHAEDRLSFVYVANPDTLTVVQSLARSSDKVLLMEEATSLTAAEKGCDLVYCPFGVTDLACPGIPTLTLIVDLLHRDFPATLPEPDRVYREQKFEAAVQVTDRFQVISDYTAARLMACYGVNTSRIFRIYPSIHSRLTLPQGDTKAVPVRVKGPFFLYPANFWIHKNHEKLFLAYALYVQRCGPTAWPLVLAGHLDQRRLNILKESLRSLNIRRQVLLTGYISERSLAAYYAAAGGLVFPSLHEGFGIPLVEAMAFGLPIIASQACSIPEIAGDAALLVDANDPGALADAMVRISSDSALRSTLAEKGRQRLSLFSIEDQYRRLLEEILQTAVGPARCQRAGYYAEDGLTDPISLYALPIGDGEITLTLRNRPLPVNRTLRITCGRNLLLERILLANQTVELSVTFRPLAKNIVLHVLDASSLSATDPRTHGVLLDQLRIRTIDGHTHDLLEPTKTNHVNLPTLARTREPHNPTPARFRHLWHLESIVPPVVPDGFLEIRGWCFGQSDQPTELCLKAGDIRWSFQAAAPRPDVRAVHPRMQTDACGFTVRIRLPSGDHELVLEAQEKQAVPTVLFKQRIRVPTIAAWNRWLKCKPATLLAFQLMLGPSQKPQQVQPEKFPAPRRPRPKWPRFAIVTPSYQQARYLRQTMLSVFEQEVDYDYVVQDGGSTDGSADLINEYASKLLAWESGPDQGQADAILTGFNKTSGAPTDLMAWLNSDDYFLPGALTFVADYFARHPEVDVLYGNRILVDEESQEISRWYLPRHNPEVLRLNDFVPQETMFWRRRIWDQAGPINPRYNFAMDWDLLLRFQAAGARIVHVPRFLACFRVHSAQKTIAAMQSVGQQEIDALRHQSCGRELSPQELENHPALTRYLRRSAFIEMAGLLGLRMH